MAKRRNTNGQVAQQQAPQEPVKQTPELLSTSVPSTGAANRDYTPPLKIDGTPLFGQGWEGSPLTSAPTDDGSPYLSYDDLQNEQNKQQPDNNGTNKLRVPLRDTKPNGVSNIVNTPNADSAIYKMGVDAEGLDLDRFISDYRKRLETDEERVEREKRERRNGMFAAIGDGLSALSNLYFTTKGAPDMYDKGNSIVDRHNKWVEKLKEQRDSDMNSYLKLLQMRKNHEIARQELKTSIMKMENEAKIAEARAKQYERLGLYYEARKAHEDAEALKAKAQEAAYKKAAEDKSRLTDSQIDLNKATGVARKTTAAANKTKADASAADAYNRSKNRDIDTNSKVASRKESNAETRRHHQVVEKKSSKGGGKLKRTAELLEKI